MPTNVKIRLEPTRDEQTKFNWFWELSKRRLIFYRRLSSYLICLYVLNVQYL